MIDAPYRQMIGYLAFKSNLKNYTVKNKDSMQLWMGNSLFFIIPETQLLQYYEEKTMFLLICEIS